ncbi:MAG: hypothetical protein ACRD3W_28975, partial [Terriglobales bacterium]
MYVPASGETTSFLNAVAQSKSCFEEGDFAKAESILRSAKNLTLSARGKRVETDPQRRAYSSLEQLMNSIFDSLEDRWQKSPASMTPEQKMIQQADKIIETRDNDASWNFLEKSSAQTAPGKPVSIDQVRLHYLLFYTADGMGEPDRARKAFDLLNQKVAACKGMTQVNATFYLETAALRMHQIDPSFRLIPVLATIYQIRKNGTESDSFETLEALIELSMAFDSCGLDCTDDERKCLEALTDRIEYLAFPERYSASSSRAFVQE